MYISKIIDKMKSVVNPLKPTVLNWKLYLHFPIFPREGQAVGNMLMEAEWGGLLCLCRCVF